MALEVTVKLLECDASKGLETKLVAWILLDCNTCHPHPTGIRRK